MNKIKIICVLCFVAFGIGALFTDNRLIPTAMSRSTGPPAGRTGAPGETTCTGCHAVNAGSGVFSITAPPSYVPGQTYPIQVQHTTSDATRLRWGFELTSLDGLNLAAGTFSNTTAFTQTITGTGTGNTRYYAEHTSSGTFPGTSGGASWIFDWTAPATNVGPVTFYAAGLQADNDNGRNGDQTYTTSTVTQPPPPTDTPTNTATPTPSATDTPTNTPTPLAVVSGTVNYGNAIGAPSVRGVPNVLVSAAGSPPLSDTTTASGTYLLTGFGAGSYTITPSKTGGQNGSITAYDAGRIAQYLTGNLSFTPAQQTVADVSGTGGISSYDAALIGRYAAALGSPTGSSGSWLFNPASNIHPSINIDVTEDYAALLMGDVSGNWGDPSPFRPVIDGFGPERSTAVELPQITASTDKEIIIPVSVQGAADKGIIAYEFDLRYDPTVAQPFADSVDLKASVSRGLSVVTNAKEPGLLRVVVYGPMPIEKDGVLLNLRFTAVGKPGSVSPISFERIMFNEGEERVTVVDGRVEVF